ncbi:helix-turn-helix transcriptional regulator [Amycolatopsis sp. NBC_00438]|uniref:helix-turn-helix transcriptional regulator n=1 Tax=Amycolatopsis sp. NBC_00438 TaxID=2903558 RepID=UPI002E20BF0B
MGQRSTSHASAKRDDLGDFLRSRRAALSPARVGLAPGRRRRTPGLRRDEVAQLANMSANYYERLERGCGPQPSTAILGGLAEALRLDAAERDYLYRLAGHVAPRLQRSGDAVDVDEGLRSLLAAVDALCPAFITDDLGSVLAQNELHVALFGSFAGRPGWERNMIWRWFTAPGWRAALSPAAQHEMTGQAYVADLRAIIADHDRGSAAVVLVRSLREASAEFARMWDEHRVSAPACSTLDVQDGRVGRLEFDCAVAIGALSRQRLITLHAIPGTGTRERLRLLAESLTGGQSDG